MPTSIDQVGVLLAYVVPGFMFFWVASVFLPPPTPSAAQLVVPSVVASAVLTKLATFVSGGAAGEGALPVVATAIGAGLALAVGAGYRVRPLRRFLNRVTLVSETRIWRYLIDEHNYYVQVQTETGDVFFGWVNEFSNDSSLELPDLYLQDAEVVAADGTRTPLEYTRGLFVPGKRIRWIQLLQPEPNKAADRSAAG